MPFSSELNGIFIGGFAASTAGLAQDALRRRCLRSCNIRGSCDVYRSVTAGQIVLPALLVRYIGVFDYQPIPSYVFLKVAV